MTDVDFKNALLAGDPDAGEGTREIKTYAGVVVVRGLTRLEVLELNRARDLGDIDVVQWERRMVATAMITPGMTEAEVGQWQAVDKAGGPLAEVTDAIAEISGLSEGASKSGVPRARA